MSGWVQRALQGSGHFPVGTLSVNLLGCLAIGALAAWSEQRPGLPAELRLFAVIGLMGGFTTYSSFGLEAYTLLRDGESLSALGYVAAHLLLGLLCVALGYRGLSG